MWPQLLALRRRSPCEPAIPVPYALAQFGPLNTELSAAGGIALRAREPFTASLLRVPKFLLRWWCWEQGSLLICAICTDDAVAGVVLMISPHCSHRLPLSHDLLTDPQRPAPAWAASSFLRKQSGAVQSAAAPGAADGRPPGQPGPEAECPQSGTQRARQPLHPELRRRLALGPSA